MDLDIYSYDGSTWVKKATIDSGAFDETITRSGITRVALVITTNDTYTAGSDTAATVSNLTLYGIDGVTSTTTNNVFDDVVDNEIDTDYLPAGAAYRAWIDAEATVVTPLVFGHTTADAKFSELTKYAANTYGWYMERVAGIPYCVPHWYALSTTPDYVIQLDRAERYDIDESSIDDLVSAVRVTYQDTIGRTQYLDVTDTDTDHPLVALGITRYGQVSAQTASTATASAIGTVYLQEHARTQAQGSVTTRYVMTANGAEVYLPSIRPGRMCRLLGLPDGYKDCIVKRVTCTGDEVATIELDNSPYRLDVLLARLGGSGE